MIMYVCIKDKSIFPLKSKFTQIKIILHGVIGFWETLDMVWGGGVMKEAH